MNSLNRSALRFSYSLNSAFIRGSFLLLLLTLSAQRYPSIFSIESNNMRVTRLLQ